jgi:hypothetical protein
MKRNEKLLYQANTVPAALAIFYLVFNTCQTIFTLNAIDVSAAGIRVMEIILMNIILSFLVFIASSEMKRYNRLWSVIALLIGIFQCVRYFIIPDVNTAAFTRISITLLSAGFILIIASLLSLVRCWEYLQVKKGM